MTKVLTMAAANMEHSSSVGMTPLEFLADLVGSLAWPLAAIAAIVLLREPVAELVNSLTSLQYKDVVLRFKRNIQKLEQAADALPSPTPMQAAESLAQRTYSTLEEQVTDLAPASPTGAILVAWTEVERAVMHAVMRLGISADYPPHVSVMRHVEQLWQQSLIDDATAEVIRQLRDLRNQAAHGSAVARSLTPIEAIEYARSASKVIRLLDSLRREGSSDARG